MVPVPYAPGTVGTGRGCGHRCVCAGNPVSGDFCSPVRMLLRFRQSEPEEEDIRAAWGDLDAGRELSDAVTRMLTRQRICLNVFVHLLGIVGRGVVEFGLWIFHSCMLHVL